MAFQSLGVSVKMINVRNSDRLLIKNLVVRAPDGHVAQPSVHQKSLDNTANEHTLGSGNVYRTIKYMYMYLNRFVLHKQMRPRNS